MITKFISYVIFSTKIAVQLDTLKLTKVYKWSKFCKNVLKQDFIFLASNTFCTINNHKLHYNI
ncbi:hypothetical protein BpHYR1_054223 [Brachionus plicatilis]|uniref:Uncharacterized protein n=1 Tax=Brachionus plicatilis TaxID=10195 RepID=A0A3M7PY71_BRAPC|nr:hypothetical protein BpHYR1_054223 [Brachionus plicatilis]